MPRRRNRRDLKLSDKSLQDYINALRHMNFAAEDCLDANPKKRVAATKKLLEVCKVEKQFLNIGNKNSTEEQLILEALQFASQNIQRVLGDDPTDLSPVLEEESDRRKAVVPKIVEIINKVQG